MTDRPHLRVVSSKCPPNMRAGVLREMDHRLSELASELSKLADSAQYDLDDEELSTAIGSAAGAVQLARLTLARRMAP